MGFRGKVKKIKNCEIVFKIDFIEFYIPATQIFSIKFENKAEKVYVDFMKMAVTNTDNCLKGILYQN